MFCRQCEQTAGGKGCRIKGVCGKSSEAAALQDLIVHGLKGVAFYGRMARDLGVTDKDTDRFVTEALFSTVTNVNFDEQRLQELVLRTYKEKQKIRRLFFEAYRKRNGEEFNGDIPEAADWKPANALEQLLNEAENKGLMADASISEDFLSLHELILYGLKGMAAYADHAAILGAEDEEVTAFFYKGLNALTDESLTDDDLISIIMELGKVNLRCMEILDEAHRKHFGNPVITKVSLGTKKGPAILVSGHDLYDLKQLLEQTAGKGVNIYTHGEMLPAHAYPELKKHKHLAGNYGGAWQEQAKEFDQFPGAILMTTNCIQKPRDTYRERIFTTGLVAWPGVEHISADRNNKKDFSKVIEKAIALGGFDKDEEAKEILVGFGHNTVLGVADKVVGAVKSGAIKHFFLIGGCDGAKPGRNYYTELAQKVPKDCLILTLACGKYRFNKLDFGTIGELPRLLDVGQCNDAYSAIRIASTLAEAFKCSVNDLPLSLILSWYEQKAVVILLTLLALGIKGIRIGPSLPAFVSPNILKILIEKFDIKPVTTPDEDLKNILAVGVAK